MKKLLLVAQLVIAAAMLMLLPGPAQAADNYIDGLSIQLEDYPTEIHVSETFTMTVRVVNESGQEVEGYLRTYLYGYENEIAYPSADFRTIVLLNEGGWSPNGISVKLGGNESKLFTFSLTVKSEVQLVDDSGASVRLRARMSRAENDPYTYIAPPDNHFITLVPKPGPEGIVGIKFGVGLAVAAAIVYSVVVVQKHNNKSTHKRARK